MTDSDSGQVIFDLECDGLLDEATKIWIGVTRDINTKKVRIFSDYVTPDSKLYHKVQPLSELTSFLESCSLAIGHNIISYDFPILKKIVGWVPPPSLKPIDTLILSMVMDYKRFGFDGHSMERWARSFGESKTEIEDWSYWSDDKADRCVRDCEINEKIFETVKWEANHRAETKPAIKKSIAAEHATFKFFAKAKERGWLVDVHKLNRTMERMEKYMSSIKSIIEAEMSPIIRPKYTGENKTRTPKYNKNGCYSHHTAKWFDIDPERGREDDPIQGEYTPIVWLSPDMNSVDLHLKPFLYSIGWKPLEWNMKKEGRKWIKTSPKLCDTSLEKLGKVGRYISWYNTTKSRYGIMSGWRESLDENNRIHGDAFVIGTPTFRCRHKHIVNVPGAEASWGPKMRGVFIAEEGNVIVGGDSAGNQARALAYYLNDAEMTEMLVYGDIHDKNAEILDCKRSIAKRWYYAFLFGAGFGKLSLYLLGYRDSDYGQEKKEQFLEAYPAIKELIENLEEAFEKTSRQDKEGFKGYIPAIDGRKVYSDSSHKLLNYLLQSFEAITCKAALLYATEKLEEEKIPYWPLTFYHDEIQIETPEKYAERVSEILVEAFTEAPKWFGVNIMGGDAKVGRSWLQTH